MCIRDRGYIAADDILKAREMDLMTYLRNYEPQELVRVSGNTYCLSLIHI